MSSESYQNFWAKGSGKTKEEAAFEFLEDLQRQMPVKKGLYDLWIRVPISHEQHTNYETNEKGHIFYMRGSWSLVAESKEEIIGLKYTND